MAKCKLLLVLLIVAMPLGAVSGQPNSRALLPARDAVPADRDWPSFRGDPQLTGVARTTLPETLTLLWQFDAKQPIESTAAIVGDTVYVGDLGGGLHALNLADGKPRWKYQAADLGIKGGPCVDHGRVFVGDYDGIFHAVDAAKGTRIWTFTADADIISSATVVGDRVLFGSSDQNLYCLAAKDGTLLWKFPMEGMVQSTPAVFDGHVFVSGCDAMLHVINLEDGTELAHVEMASPTPASPLVTEQFAYVGTYANRVQGIDWKNHRVLWDYDPPKTDFAFMSSPALDGGVLVIGGRDKSVHGIDPKTGEAAWTFPTRRQVDSSPVIVGSRVFIGSGDGNLYALDLKSGAKKWQFTLGESITASPAVAHGRLVIGAHDGSVYCFGRK